MTQHLFKLFLLSLLCAAWPGRVGAEVQRPAVGCRADYLRKTVAEEQNPVARKVTANNWHKRRASKEGEAAMTWLFMSLLVLGTIALIVGLIAGSNVLIPVLIVGACLLYFFIVSRVVASREKKNGKSRPAPPPKK